jgi:transcriptional regulator with XRE-family HTH domain
MNFNEKLQHLRASRKLSQEELAGRLDVSRQAVTKWENGVSHS